MNTRFIEVRKALSLTQKDMGKALGLSNSGISNIENGTRNVTDKHLKLLSSILNINENWMRTGKGTMFLTDVSSLINVSSLDEADRKILTSYIQMTPKQRKFIKSWIKDIASSIKNTDQAADRRAEAHRLVDEQLDAEEKAQSASSSGVSDTEKRA